jgi:HEAT repeat protein
LSEPRQILEELASDPGAARDRLRVNEDASVLIEALRISVDERPTRILCDVLGYRQERSAVDDLVGCLGHSSSKVRSAAADALAKIGDPRAGAAILARFLLPDPNIGVRRMLLAALGAVQHRPAIPMLIDWLGNPDDSQRGAAAWSLGAMRAESALDALREAERIERMPYPKERIREAIRVISEDPAR